MTGSTHSFKPEGRILSIVNFGRFGGACLHIAPEKTKDDIFDLPPHELKKLVQGFIWRDEHFAGLVIKDIALQEKCSQSYVGTAIFDSFKILQTV